MIKNKFCFSGILICLTAIIVVLTIQIYLATNFNLQKDEEIFFYGITEQLSCIAICLIAGFVNLILLLFGAVKQESKKIIISNVAINLLLIPVALLQFWKWMI